MVRSIAVFAFTTSMTLQGAVPTDHATNMAESRALFTSKVRAILDQHCVRCHGGEKTKSGLDLTTREGLLEGGDQDVGIVVGQSRQSLLYQAVAHLEEDLAMPPKKPKLPDEAIAAIAKWIDLGAAYDKPLVEKGKADKLPMQVSEEDRRYWAYAPLRTVTPPPGGDSSQGAIDRFVAAHYRAKGLTPAEPLGKAQLIRRAFFDLIGLPPTPEEVDRFVASTDAEAYPKLLDELLARPGYGERWGRHWLDLARFAESHGFEHDYDRKFAFHYRDFVIRALNADLPYDQFVKWQIAGDELDPENPEAMAATGFLGAGVYPTQITISEAERVRFDALDDMVATMGSAMLATTVGCARCHDHKYDPIPARDYYELLSAFTTTVRSEIELETVPSDPAALTQWTRTGAELATQAEHYRKHDAPRNLRAWLEKNRGTDSPEPASRWTIMEPTTLVSKGGTKFERQDDASWLATGPNPDFDTYTFTAPAPRGAITAIRIEALAHKSMVRGGPGRAPNGNFALSDVTVTAGKTPLVLANPLATFNQGNNLHANLTIDGDRKSSWAVDPQFGQDHAVVYEVANGTEAKAPLTVTLQFNGNNLHNIGLLRISTSTQPPAALPLLEDAAYPLEATRSELLTLARNDAGIERMVEVYLPLDEGWAELAAARAQHQAAKPVGKKEKVMVCSEGRKPMRHHTSSGKIPDFYTESFQLVRGDPAQKDGPASLGFLKVLMRNGATAAEWIEDAGPGARTSLKRTAVANWITDVENGAGHLLARVIVNRLWQHHFGRGLVGTPNDFGFQGTKPTHPDLLDHLARDLIAHGWKLKRLHKQIMLSDTYQLGGSDDARNREVDPGNLYWWKREPRRLEAEIIRDNALAVSGLLDRTMFGPGTLDQKMKRRSIYFFVKRSKLVPMMQLFDWPDTMTSLGRRTVTTTPSQALVFINSPEVREMATHFARSLASERDPVEAAVRRARGTPPTGAERELMLEFLNNQTHSHGGKKEPALVDFCHALLATNEMIYVE